MLATRSNFGEVIGRLAKAPQRSLDTETTGLRPHHGSRLFSIIIAARCPEPTAFYFNFQAYPGLPPDQILTPNHLHALGGLLAAPEGVWFLHNAKYDMAILAREGLFLEGTIHCTKAMARVEYNEHMDYDLAACAERIGLKKDDAVERYILEKNLWEWETIPGKKQRKKNRHFDQVPFDVIAPYGETDALVTLHLGESQEASFALVDQGQVNMPLVSKQRNIINNERTLTQVVFRMEERGVLIDIPYTQRALAYESDRASKALDAFKRETGRDFIASAKLFSEVFASERDKWAWTEKGNASFDAEVFKSFSNPAARCVLDYRDAKSKADFYAGFMYHADSSGILHPHFNPDGTRTGRFSSSDPNFQNLTDEEGLEAQEFLVRRAIIPRPGHLFLMPDYDQMEYRMMLDYAQEEAVIAKVLEGMDVHQATAELMGVTRKEAKTINFMLLYGGGAQKLATALGISLDAAKALKAKYFSVLPGVQRFISEVQQAVVTRGFIRNWAGRRCYYPNLDYSYTGPNTLIQGGTADVNKFGLVHIDKYLASMKSKLVLTIHDENPIEAHEDEAEVVARRVKEIMESVYPAKSLPLTVGMEYSRKSLGDKVKGFPNA